MGGVKGAVRFVSREKDELVLCWIDDRIRGVSPSVIAEFYGVGWGAVVVATQDVRAHDVAQAAISGENVQGAYW